MTKKSDGVRVHHERKSGGVRVLPSENAMGESSP